MTDSVEQLDDAQLSALYAEFADEDRHLAEHDIEDYENGLLVEDILGEESHDNGGRTSEVVRSLA